MKVACTYEQGQICQHFGQTRIFKVYEIENKEIVSSELIVPGGDMHCALGGWLSEQGVEALICGGIGGGARNALAHAGVQLFPGVSGSADQAAAAFATGALGYNPDATCAGHDHGEGHTCHGHH